MKQIERMTEDHLRSVVKAYVDSSTLYMDTAVATQQREAYHYYYGLKPQPSNTKGKSTVVSRDVADAIDWIMPSLMRIFQGDKDVVRLCPENSEDIEQAKLEQQYLNYVFNRKNDGYQLTYDFLQDGLLNKNGVFKCVYRVTKHKRFSNYSGLTMEQLQQVVASDPSMELIESSTVETEDGMFFDVRIATSHLKEEQKVMAVPAEEFLVNSDATCLEDASFLAHRAVMTRSEAISMGFDEETIMSLDSADRTATVYTNQVYQARNSVDATNAWSGKDHNNKLQELIWINECYVHVDYDGDGYAELRQVFTSEQGIVLSNMPVEEHPFATASPFRMAHKLMGMSMYDVLKEVQDIKTTLIRNLLNNMYNLNNGRYEVVEGMVNLDDLMNNKLGGVVRTKGKGMINSLQPAALPVHNFQMLEYFDQIRTDRSGVSQRTKGLDSNTLHSNQAASSVWSTMGAAEQRIEMIARMFAHGFRDMFKKLRNNILRYQDAEAMMEVNGNFIPVDPRTWRADRDVVIATGIGNDNKQERMQYMTQLIQTAQAVIGAGGKDIHVTDDNIHNMLLEYTRLAGYENAEEFWNNPNNEQAQQAKQAKQEAAKKPKPEEITAQAKMLDAQTNQAKAQVEAQYKDREMGVEERSVAVKEAELPIKEEQNNIAREKNQIDLASTLSETMLEKQQNRNVQIGNRT